MKKFFTVVAILIGGLTNAQECAVQDDADYGADENETKKFISLYSEPLKQKNYKEAADFWWKAQAASPKYKTNLYYNGVYIYQKLAKAAKKSGNKDKAKAVADSLFIVYDLWIENYGDCYEIKMKYADDRVTYFPEDYELSYGKFKDAFAGSPIEDIKSSSVQRYFTTAYMMVQNKKAECDLLLNLYDELSGICEKNGISDKNFAVAQKTLDKYVAPCASCDKLEELFKPKFEATPDDMDLMKKIVNMMAARDCADNEFYFDVVIKLHEKEPSFTSAMGIGKKYYKEGDYKNAVTYFEDALSMAETEEDKQRLYTLLVSTNGKLGRCNDRIKYAGMIGSDEKNAETARCIASKASSCGNTNVQRSFAYCLALDYAEKAGGKVSSGEIKAWKDRLAASQDIFFENYEVGQSVPVPCWDGETTKIRAKG